MNRADHVKSLNINYLKTNMKVFKSYVYTSFLCTSCQTLKLHAHHFAELLESLHELLIISVLGHGLFGVRFKHVNCLHVLRVREKFVNLIVRSNVVKKVLGHPLLSCFVKIVVHFHRLLNLLYLQGVFLGRFQFRYLLLFLFSLLRCSRSTSS